MRQPNPTAHKFIAHRREVDGAIQPLEQHLRAVGRLSARNASKLTIAAGVGAGTDGTSLQNAGEVLGLLHDLGKYSKEFQDYLGSAVGLIDQDADDFVNASQLRGRIDHSTAGAQYIWQHLSEMGPTGSLSGQILALCIASHHSGLIDCLAPDGQDNFTRRINKAEQRAHLAEALANADAPVLGRLAELLASDDLALQVQQFVRGIVDVEHRAERSNVVVQFKLGLLVRFLFSCLIDADRVDTADFERPRAGRLRQVGRYPAWEILMARLERHLLSFSSADPIDGLRRDVSEHCRVAAARERGYFTLTVPTGGAKTLSSLRFALHHAKRHGLDRVIYVVPFTSIIDQNADVVRRVLEPLDEGIEGGSIVLEHHSNLTPDEQTWRAKILAENWDAPVIFTTSVQLLETLFGAGTRGARRMHQLARSVVIFDEIQTIPVRCVHLFNNALNFLVEHCGSSVVLCTATQPLLNGVNPQKGAARFRQGDEIIPDVQRLFDALRRTQVIPRHQPGGWSDEEVATLAADEIASTGSCLIIVNTRAAALNLYRMCAEGMAAAVFHLSTSMCPAHRRGVLGQLRQRLEEGSPTLCISTQLIEAGVDVDFGAVIRHVAGLDSVAQAAGRCNRHGRRAIGRVHLINPAEARIDRLVDIRFGRDVTQRILSEFEARPDQLDRDLLGPKALEQYFRYYFYQRAEDMDYPVSPEVAGRDDQLLNMLAENRLAVNEHQQHQQSSPPLALRQGFMTAARAFRAIDAPTQGVIVPYGPEGLSLIGQLHAAFDSERHAGLMRDAQQFSVNVFPQIFEALRRADAVSEIGADTGIYTVRSEYYSPEFGLHDQPVAPPETLHA